MREGADSGAREGGVEEEGEDQVDEGRGVREEEWINEGGRGKHPEVTHPWRV